MSTLFISSAVSLTIINIGSVTLLGGISGLLTSQAVKHCFPQPLGRLPFLLAGVLLALFLCILTINWLSLIGTLFLSSVLITLSIIDIRQLLLPDRLTQPLLWSGLFLHSLSNQQQLSDAIYGVIIGYAGFYLLHWGSRLLQGRAGLGYGDVKLFAALGAWTGWQALPMIALIAACCGIVLFAFFNRLINESGQLPFGPCLSFAGLSIYISQANGSDLVF